MKFFFILLYCILNAVITFGQTPSTAAEIGKVVQQIALGSVINNSGIVTKSFQGRKFIQDFKGKLVILDFWATYCAPCIRGFKKMSELQEKYKDDIQIFLVNPVQDELEVGKWLKQQNTERTSNIVPDNLPMLVNAKEIFKIFPSRGEIGYHIWIDENGVFLGRGISENTNERKIENHLSGKSVSFVNDNARAYNWRKPFFAMDSQSSPTPLFSSSFGLFDDLHASAYGSGRRNIIDSIAGTIRNTYLNYSIMDLYNFSIEDILKKDSLVLFGSRFELAVPDSSLISQDEHTLKRPITDEDIRNAVCYEQIVPLDTEDSVRLDVMLNDLNRYFGFTFGVTGQWERQVVSCYKLTLNSLKKRTSSASSVEKLTNTYKGDTLQYNFNNYSVRKLFSEYFSIFSRVKDFECERLIINDVHINENIDLILPDPYRIKNIDELREILQNAGFDLRSDFISARLFLIKKT